MIVGIGTDIVSLERIGKVRERSGDTFAKRVLTGREFDRFQQIAEALSTAWLAKRFAAKEAASKALGTGIGKVSFHDLEVWNERSGVPRLTLHGNARTLADRLSVSSAHLTLSDEIDFAVAFVILESEGKA